MRESNIYRVSKTKGASNVAGIQHSREMGGWHQKPNVKIIDSVKCINMIIRK